MPNKRCLRCNEIMESDEGLATCPECYAILSKPLDMDAVNPWSSVEGEIAVWRDGYE